jgi:NADPH2:quinone reductase
VYSPETNKLFVASTKGKLYIYDATYATNTPMPQTPVWQLVFVNARLFFVGSDDVPAEAKIEATLDINKALEAGWPDLDIAEIVPLDQTARAHELVEHPAKPGRVIVALT